MFHKGFSGAAVIPQSRCVILRRMKPDFYTKAVLTVIAFLLLLIACNQYVSPHSAVQAAGPFAHVQFTPDTGTLIFFDTNTGQIWHYNGVNRERVVGSQRLAQLGQPLIVEAK